MTQEQTERIHRFLGHVEGDAWQFKNYSHSPRPITDADAMACLRKLGPVGFDLYYDDGWVMVPHEGGGATALDDPAEAIFVATLAYLESEQ